MPDTQTIVFSRKIVLTDSDIKSLPTNSFVIVAALGANKIINPVEVCLIPDFAPSPDDYDNINVESYLTVVYQGDNVEFMPYVANADGVSNLSAFLTNLGQSGQMLKFIPMMFFNSFGGRAINMGFKSDLVNKPLLLYVDNEGAGNFTGGNSANTLTVLVSYTIIDL